MTIVTAVAHPNIAFIKYWGNRDDGLNLPANGSISMNLAGLETRTEVEFNPSLDADDFRLQNVKQEGAAAARVSAHLDLLRARAGESTKARICSWNNFPVGAGMASSASAFAALTVAAAAALGLKLTERELSALARRGSGSACRSVPAGFTEWRAADCDADSYAESLAPPGHWALVDLIAVVGSGHKKVLSLEGHRLALTSPMQAVRVSDSPRRLEICRKALLARDFPALAEILEEDTRLMHAVMLTSRPPLLYWMPETFALLRIIPVWRAEGLPVAYSIDAGPNVHCICPAHAADAVVQRLREQAAVVQILRGEPGGAARVV